MLIEQILEERKKTHGDFKENSFIMQEIKNIFRSSRNFVDLSDDKKEALDMIAHKIGRILSGNPEVKDHWTDIIGYAKLVEQTLKEPILVNKNLNTEVKVET